MGKLFQTIFRKKEYFVFASTLIFWGILYIFSPGVKILTFLLFFWILIYSIYFKNIRLGAILGFIISLPIVVGKIYSFEVIPVGHLWQYFYPQGYYETIVIKPINIVTLLMLLILIRDFLSGQIPKVSLIYFAFLLAAFVFMGISSVFYSINPEVSLLIFIQLLQIPTFLLFLLVYLFPNKGAHGIMVASLSATTIAVFFLVFLQFLKSSRLGLSIEISPEETLSPATFEQTFIAFRPFGTFYNANSLAAFFMPLLAFFLIHGVFVRKITSIIAFVSSLLIIILSLGRSAWIGGTVALLMSLYYVENYLKINVLQFVVRRVKIFLIPILVVLVVSSYLIFPRVITSFDTFRSDGGGYVRILQAKEALEVISRYPLFGIGLGMGVTFFSQLSLQSSVFAFPNQTHNGYLQLATETGLPTLLFILLFLATNIYIINKLAKQVSSKNKVSAAIAFSLISGVIGFLVNALFQPYLIQHREPLFELIVLVVFLGLYYVSQPKLSKA